MGIVGASALLLSASVAFAEEGSVSAMRVETRDTVKQEVAERAQTVREESKKKLEATREEVKVRTEAAREETKKKMEASREEMKTRIETAREESKQRMETKREETKQRLSEIKDKKKQEMAERIAAQFDKINSTWTDRFVEKLDRYESIVLKIQKRADTSASVGKDVTMVTTAVKSAQTAIASARTTVAAQAAKTYTLDTSTLTTSAAITTDSGQGELVKALRASFQTMHSALFKDLFALRDGPMTEVRKTVEAALSALKQVPKVDDDDTVIATSTANQ